MVRLKIVPVLEAQKADQDADVRYFAAKALQQVRTVETGGTSYLLLSLG